MLGTALPWTSCAGTFQKFEDDICTCTSCRVALSLIWILVWVLQGFIRSWEVLQKEKKKKNTIGLGWCESCHSNSGVNQIIGQRVLEKVGFSLVPNLIRSADQPLDFYDSRYVILALIQKLKYYYIHLLIVNCRESDLLSDLFKLSTVYNKARSFGTHMHVSVGIFPDISEKSSNRSKYKMLLFCAFSNHLLLFMKYGDKLQSWLIMLIITYFFMSTLWSQRKIIHQV